MKIPTNRDVFLFFRTAALSSPHKKADRAVSPLLYSILPLFGV